MAIRTAIRTQTPGNYPKRNKLHLEHGESLKTRIFRYDGTSSNRLQNMWHFSLRATMSLHILRFENVRFLLTCYLTQYGYTCCPSPALTASTGTNRLSLRSATYVLCTCYVQLYPCSHTYILRVYLNNSIFSYILQPMFSWISHIHRVSQVGFQCCRGLTITAVTQSRLLTDFADVPHRSLRSTKIWWTTSASMLTIQQKRMLKSVISIHFCSFRCWNCVIIRSCTQQTILRFTHTYTKWQR